MASRPSPSAWCAAPHAGGLLQVRGPVLSAAQGEQGGRGDRSALALKQSEPTPGTRDALSLGHSCWGGHQEGHSWQVAVQALIFCGVSAPLLLVGV